MFNSTYWIKKLDSIIKSINHAYEKVHKNPSNKITLTMLKKIKEDAITYIDYNIKFIDDLPTNQNESYNDGLYFLPIDSLDNFTSCSPYFSTTLLSLKDNQIEWTIITFPALSMQIIFTGEKISYNAMNINGYPVHYLNPSTLNGVDILINKEYGKYLNYNTIVTRNSLSILLLLIINKVKYGIISKQIHEILNILIKTLLKYSNINFEEKEKYFICNYK